MSEKIITRWSRRTVVRSLICGAATAQLMIPKTSTARDLQIEVWKDPSCGCCDDWIAYLQANGFQVTSYNEGAIEAMDRLGMPTRYGSCHTASIEGYAVEGHVPVREILRLVQERPDAVGISVPGMPRGSPGMDGPMYGNVEDPYDVLLIGHDGTATVFQSYR